MRWEPGINDYNNNVAIPLLGIPLDSRFITNSPYTSYATYPGPPRMILGTIRRNF